MLILCLLQNFTQFVYLAVNGRKKKCTKVRWPLSGMTKSDFINISFISELSGDMDAWFDVLILCFLVEQGKTTKHEDQ